MTKTSTTRVHNRKTVNLRKKLLCVMAVSAASLLSSSALANTETISVPQIVNETTLQDVGKHLASYNEFFLTELGAIWVDGVQLDLSNVKLTGNHVRLQVGGPDFPYQNAKAISSGGSLTVGSITATGTNIIHVIGTTNRDSTLTVKGDINASNLDVWINGKNTNTNTKISVEGNFTETEDSKISAQYNGILEVKGGLTVNISDKGSFYIANSKNVPISLKVGKDFTFSNHITKNNNFDPNGLFFDASIGTAAAEIGGDFILQGANDAPTTYFQIANSKGAGVKAANIQVIGSDNNTTSLLFSRFSIVNVGSGNGVIELRPDGNNSKVQLFIGESDYKAKSILASELKMNQSEGSDGIFVFLNNNVQDLKQNFVFVPKITGHGHIENLGGYNVLRSAESTYTGKTVVTDGTLILAAPTGAGQSNIEVNTEAGNTTKGLYLQFQSDAGPIENKISGDGVIRVAGEVSVKSSDISDYHGEWDVLGKLKTVDGSFTTSSQWGTGNVNIEPQGSVVVTNNSNGSLFVFDNTLSGSGTLLVNFSGSENGTDLYAPTFKIQQGTTSEFTGMVELAGEKNKKVVYILDSDELSTSGIRVSDNSVLSVGRDDSSKGTFTLGKLDIAGGELNIGDIQTGSPTSNKTIRVTKKLNADGEGTVRIDTSAGFINAVPTTESELETLPLMEQDDGLQKTSMMLVNAKGAEIIGSGGGLSLVDQNGKVLSNALTSKVIQNGVHVANAGYDWKLTTSGSEEEASGLYLNYGLTQVELLGQGDSALILYATPRLPENSLANDLSAKVVGSGDLKISAVGETVSLSNPENTYTGGTFVTSDSTLKLGAAASGGKDLRAKVTGDGDLRIDAPNDYISLSNPNNDYTGKTFVDPDSTLKLLADSALGSTSEVLLEENATLDLANTSQTVGRLNAGENAKVHFGEPKESDDRLDQKPSQLTIREGGQIVSADTLTGSGTLTVESGTLDIEASNPNLHTNNVLFTEAKVNMKSSSGLGDGTIELDGELNLNGVNDGPIQNQLSGMGRLNLFSSDLALTADNSGFEGDIQIDPQSELTVSNASNLGKAAASNNGYLIINNSDDWTLSNDITGSGSVRKEGHGTLSIINDTLWNGKTEINEGELHLGTPNSVVTSNSSSVVIGQNGTLSGFAVLKGDLVHAGTLNIGTQDSEPSVFLVEGNYIGNNGLVNFKGYLEGDSSPVDKLIVRGSTSGTSRVVVTNMGAMGGRTSKGIELIHVDGQSDGTFIQEGRIVAGAFEYRLVRGEGANSNHWYLKTEDDQVRPEIGSYIANEETVQTSFVTRQLDRGGKTEYTDFFTGEKKSTSLWLRQAGRYNSWQDSSGNTKTRSNRYISQIGGDIAAWTDAENQQALHLGLMAGYAHSRAISHSVVNGQRSIGKTDGYGLGMYATWFEDEINQQGAYVDAWFNYSWFKSSVNGNDNPKEKYRSRGLTGSLEAGYTQKLGSNNYGDWYVQPQAQVIWMGVTTPNRTEKNGTHVRFNGHGNIQSRIGTRFYIQGRVPGSDQGVGSFQLYTDVNWIHNTRKFGVTMNQDGFTQAGASNLAELKFGGERKVGKNLHLWGNVGSRFGSHDYRELSATIGAKFVF